jgi:molybdopterin-guanine dinucleotide biosynthesis protein A
MDAATGIGRGPSAPLWGLVLAGGRGTRLGGRDKGAAVYHGMPQARWLAARLSALCEEVRVAVRPDQAGQADYAGLALIFDKEPGLGPAAALLAAWDAHPDVAWLVVAADMPLIDLPLLGALVEARDASKAATALRHPDGTLEPLCAIYEPAMRDSLSRQWRSPEPSAGPSLRRALAAAATSVVVPREPWRLRSVNTPADDAAVRERLARS